MKYLALCLLFALLPLSAFAQEYPRSEFVTNYSYLRTDQEDLDLNGLASLSRRPANLNGWNINITGNPTKWFGAVFDVGGAYGNIEYRLQAPGLTQSARVDSRFHSVMAGPQFSFRGGPGTVFVRGLAGVAFASQNVTLPLIGRLDSSDKSFAFGGGGGFDIRISDRISIRALQADVIFTRFDVNVNGLNFPGDRRAAIRISTGFVFRNRD